MREVALKLKVATKTILRLIRTGELPAIKVGRDYRIPASEYERFITPKSKLQPKPHTQKERIAVMMRGIQPPRG